MYRIVEASDTASILGDTNSINIINLLKSKWDELHDQNDVFRYKIDTLQEKYVNKYLIQLNPDRGTKRRMPEVMESICQPFDKSKFNFTKVSVKEILFHLIKESNDSDIHSMVINASPISRYHTLLCPWLSKCLPQIITVESLELALEIMFISRNRDLRIGFNSLCGKASVNHLHYHLFLEPNTLPVESVKCKHLKGPLFCLKDYVAPAFCFQLQSQETIAVFTKEIFKVFSYLLSKAIAHNVFITRGESVVDDGGKEMIRMIIWPRKNSPGAKEIGAFNIAVCELAGWLPIYDKTAYDTLTSEDYEQELKKWQIVNFDMVCEELKSLF